MLYTIVYSCLHVAEYRLYSMIYSMAQWYACYIAPYPPASLTVYLADRQPYEDTS